MTTSAGLVGSGPWAALVHAPGLAAHDGVRFSHLWTRNADAGAELADRFGLELCASYDELLDAVDLVSLCVPPSVQAGMAASARARGRLVLLEKPVADSPSRAHDIAVAGSSAAVVNYSLLLADSVQPWIEEAAGRRWAGGRVVTTNDVLLGDSPFAASPWRQAPDAALWDLGPHAISFLTAVLGPVEAVRATSRDRVITVGCDHVSGARSEVVCSLAAEAGEVGFAFVDEDGRRETPVFAFDAARSYAGAVDVLLDGPASRAQRAVSDLAFSTHVVAVIAAAEASLAGGGRGGQDRGRSRRSFMPPSTARAVPVVDPEDGLAR